MYILARSISQGRQAGLVSALGIGSRGLVHTIAAFGLSAILATSAWAFTAIKFAGAVYLIYQRSPPSKPDDGRYQRPVHRS